MGVGSKPLPPNRATISQAVYAALSQGHLNAKATSLGRGAECCGVSRTREPNSYFRACSGFPVTKAPGQ